MKDKFARPLVFISVSSAALSTALMLFGIEPFHNQFYLFIWWFYIGFLDGWLYLKGGEPLFLKRPLHFLAFLVPFSALLWFVFEAFNLRLQNWYYINVPAEIWLRWPGNFIAFGTVLPGIFLTANLLDHYGVLRRNEFSRFFNQPLPGALRLGSLSLGILMAFLPLLFPGMFFPLVWGAFVFLLDPLNADWGGRSLIQEWRQGNFSRTFQLLLAGLLCGGLWELWNFWAGAKWIYSVPLPDFLAGRLKIFEMPLLGFLGFPPFALECFVMAEFAGNVRERLSPWGWRGVVFLGFLFSLMMCRLMDLHTVHSFR